ncbi:lipocalin family protein [Polaribacter sp. PL03]|uniref:lipocalin family protein n=1 Tax=Polaribacter sp. PL03 TaxID=3088353 RepID=UPI0029D30D64|nr:lipocalin family protein [Polaribacter sp. PL03]MDX6745425.1 lipocalin family protein [Polaribacter sp. PL03]
MKKIMLLMFVATIFSCAASKSVRTKEKTIKGNWVLNKITYSKTGDYNVTMFNDATKECLEGSSWKFVPNNNSGVYTVDGANCITGERDFIFVIQEIDETSGYYDFLLKPKNNESNIGFRVELSNLTESTMKWKQNLMVNGTPFIINMDFIKQ